MQSFKRKWRRLTWYEKVAFAVGAPSAALLILYGILHLLEIEYTTLRQFVILTVVLMLSQAVLHLRKKRKRALICACTALFTAIAYTLSFLK